MLVPVLPLPASTLVLPSEVSKCSHPFPYFIKLTAQEMALTDDVAAVAVVTAAVMADVTTLTVTVVAAAVTEMTAVVTVTVTVMTAVATAATMTGTDPTVTTVVAMAVTTTAVPAMTDASVVATTMAVAMLAVVVMTATEAMVAVVVMIAVPQLMIALTVDTTAPSETALDPVTPLLPDTAAATLALDPKAAATLTEVRPRYSRTTVKIDTTS